MRNSETDFYVFSWEDNILGRTKDRAECPQIISKRLNHVKIEIVESICKTGGIYPETVLKKQVRVTNKLWKNKEHDVGCSYREEWSNAEIYREQSRNICKLLGIKLWKVEEVV